MKVVVLGTAAGGGFPQWNCACPTCADRGLPPRTQDGLAIGTGDGWYLVNASPDLRAQILAAPDLRAGPGPRDTPIRGVLLTDAELDHVLGLMTLREGEGLDVYAPPAVLSALQDDFPVRAVVGHYGSWSWSAVGDDQEIGGLRVRALAVSDKVPRYAAGDRRGPWVVAYRFDDPRTGGALVYAPCLATFPPEFGDFVDGAAVVLLDGTFYDGEEFAGRTRATPGAQVVMGHVPITASLERLVELSGRQTGTRWAYTHLNNTNPVLDPDSPQSRILRSAGVEVLPDLTTFEL